MSGGVAPPTMDGKSLLPLLTTKAARVPSAEWRQDFLVEHSGEHKQTNKGCPQYNGQNLAVSSGIKKNATKSYER